MERNKTQTKPYPQNTFEFANDFNENDDAEASLNTLLELNRKSANEELLLQNHQEKLDETLLNSPISTEKAYSLFGLFLGTIPPMTLFSKFVYQNLRNPDDFWLIFLLILVNSASAVAGYNSGKLIGRIMSNIENKHWLTMILVSPFIGLLWGIIAGGIGGLFFVVIGAIFGAIIGASVGGVALPIFSIFHRLLKKGDSIERDQFLPLALGITFIISAFILGLKF